MIGSDSSVDMLDIPRRNRIGGYMLRILICDDDALFLENLRSRIRTILSCEGINAMVLCFQNPTMIPTQHLQDCDIAFLDIDFSHEQYSGIDLAKRIRKYHCDAVIIFVTNYIEYAPEGYELQAFRYALKKDIEKKLPTYLHQAIEKSQDIRQIFQVNISGETFTFELGEISYFESQGHTVNIHIQKLGQSTDRVYRFYSTMGKLESELGEKGFLRIHKGYLANITHIHRLQCQGATLKNGITLPVSEKNYSDLKKKYLLWKGRR